MRNGERWLVVAVCLVIGWFYVWTVRSSGDPWKFGAEQRDYYNLLIDGYLDGHLHMKVDVPEELLKLKDPYDPNTRPMGLGLHDASFYKGKYYVYFGAAPMVVLMLPFRLLTGIDLPQSVAALVFVYAAFLASVAMFLAVRRRYFPDAGTLVVLTGVIVLGVAGLGPVLLRRPHMWELPIGAGYCFAMLTLGCIWCSLHSERRRGRWFAAAGLALGLAIASRPTYLITSPFLVVPLVWWWWNERRLPWRMAVNAAVPLAIIGGLMAWHNYARFDHPLQFGQAYQLSLDYESKMAHFRATHVPFNVWRYFFSAAQWSPYFPFIHPAELPPKPPGFGGHDDVYGVLRNMPIAWLALAAPLALWRRERQERAPFGVWLASIAVLFAAMAGTLILFFGSLARYQSDFTPALMLLAGVGLLAVERSVRAWRAPALRVAVGALLGAAAIYSVVFAALFSVQLDGLLGERNPAKQREVARMLNRISAAAGRVAGVKHGAVEVTFRLPESRPAGEETLMTCGAPPRLDRVFLRYANDGRVQVGFEHFDAPAMVSRPLSLAKGQSYRLRATIGSLFPPSTHPYFAKMSEAGITRLTRRVRIEVDDEPVIDGYQRFVGGAVARVGEKAFAKAGSTRFSGVVESVRRVSGGENTSGTGSEFVRLRFTPVEGGPLKQPEPLLNFGAGNAALRLTVARVEGGKVKFGFTPTTGGEPVESELISIAPAIVHELVLEFDSLPDSQLRRMVMRLDGLIVWSRELRLPLDFASQATAVDGSGVKIFELQRGTAGRDPLLEKGNTLKLRVKWPRDKTNTREPLVVTGQNGGGDLLMVEYLDDTKVRFVLDHWGASMLASNPVRIARGIVQDVEITLTSLATVDDATIEHHVRRGQVSVKLDDVRVWQQEAEFYTAETAEIAIGRNQIGGTGCGPVFTGEVWGAERVARE